MDDWIREIVLVMAGAAVTAIGFFAKRFFTKAAHHERATFYGLLTDLKAKMAEQGVSADDLDSFAAQLSPKIREANTRAIAASYEEPQHYWTQGAMNERGWAEYQLEEAKLNQAVVEFGTLLKSPDRLRQVQEAWESYRDAAAEFAAAPYRGGSIQPLIRAGELTSITRERLARIEADVQDHRSRYG